jgi:hypothetical protein
MSPRLPAAGAPRSRTACMTLSCAATSRGAREHSAPRATRRSRRFGGVEGLRSLCIPRVTVTDRRPWLMRTSLPPPLRYPVAAHGFAFVHALCRMFYGTNVATRAAGLWMLARLSVWPPRAAVSEGGKAKVS